VVVGYGLRVADRPFRRVDPRCVGSLALRLEHARSDGAVVNYGWRVAGRPFSPGRSPLRGAPRPPARTRPLWWGGGELRVARRGQPSSAGRSPLRGAPRPPAQN